MKKVFKQIVLYASMLTFLSIPSCKKTEQDSGQSVSSLFTLGANVQETIEKSWGEDKVIGYQVISDGTGNVEILSFNQTFKEDFLLEFYMPDPYNALSNKNEGIVFVVENTAGETLFTVEKKALSNTSPNGKTTSEVSTGNRWYYSTTVYTNTGEKAFGEDNGRRNDHPAPASNRVVGTNNDVVREYQFSTGLIQFEWLDTGVTVLTTNKSDTGLSKLATVKKMKMPEDGYRIKIKSASGGYPAALVLVQCNGTSLSGKTIQ